MNESALYCKVTENYFYRAKKIAPVAGSNDFLTKALKRGGTCNPVFPIVIFSLVIDKSTPNDKRWVCKGGN